MSPSCDECGKQKTVMLAMMPGKDGVPWHLCPMCWVEGITPWNAVNDIVEPLVLSQNAAPSVPTPAARQQSVPKQRRRA